LLTGGLDNPAAAGSDAGMEIHRADPAYRNRTVLLLAFTVLLCVVLLLLLDAWLGRVNSQLTGSDPETVRRWLQGLLAGLGIALAVPAGLLGVGLRRLGLASRIEGRFPPQAWKTLRDVRVLRDADALRWAHRTELAGLAAIALAVLLVAWAGWAWLRFG
jgi:ABC-type Fe3+ transport system permease subunit